MKQEIHIKGLRFVLTCPYCPEQYDVYHGHRQVGYVRLRHSRLRVDYPTCAGETVFQCPYGNSDTGMFLNDEDRMEYLEKIAVIIKDRIKNEKRY